MAMNSMTARALISAELRPRFGRWSKTRCVEWSFVTSSSFWRKAGKGREASDEREWTGTCGQFIERKSMNSCDGTCTIRAHRVLCLQVNLLGLLGKSIDFGKLAWSPSI